ncbi:hypothetical protein L7F22_013714 [Adiantum nelumboides]|nr:hypothetical protein [Adiantum nelumboides]
MYAFRFTGLSPLVVRGEEKIPVDENGKRMLDQERKLSETWADMEKVYESGKAKAIGISNASQALLEELLPKVKVVPAANQIELHPYLPQHNLVNFCQAKGIVCEAYSPLGSTGSPLLQEDAVQAIAKSKGCDPAQVVISWGAQRGVAVLPKSVTPSRIESNATFVALDEDDMRKLNEIYQGSGKQKRFGMPAVRRLNPPYAPLPLADPTLSLSFSLHLSQWGADFRFDDWKVPGAYTIKV